MSPIPTYSSGPGTAIRPTTADDSDKSPLEPGRSGDDTMGVNSKSGSLILCGAACAAIALSCDDYTGPFRDPNAPVIPSFADSAFGSGVTKWFTARTYDSVLAAA